MKHVSLRRLVLMVIGWLMVVIVIALSLLPVPASLPDVPQGDKYGHLMAYFSLMFWFAQLYGDRRQRLLFAVFFILLGGVLEWLQSLTGYRQLDIMDFIMNTLGVLCGLIFSSLIDLRRYFV